MTFRSLREHRIPTGLSLRGFLSLQIHFVIVTTPGVFEAGQAWPSSPSSQRRPGQIGRLTYIHPDILESFMRALLFVGVDPNDQNLLEVIS